MRKIQILFFPFLFLLFIACSTSKKIKSTESSIDQLFSKSTVFGKHFTGFALYDPVSKTFLYQKDATKYYTPASNTKTLTLLASIKNLPATLPSFKYIEKKDSLIIKGMGDPSFLHPLWPDHPAVTALKNSSKPIYLVIDQYVDLPFGPGWAWDDFQDNYQVEVSDFPMYGNLADFLYDSIKNSFISQPAYFQDKWYWMDQNNDRNIGRNIDRNEFFIKSNIKENVSIPFTFKSTNLKIQLLEQAIGKSVSPIRLNAIHNADHQWKIQYGVPIDSVYAQMMKISDNFIAEQLLLVAGSLTMDTVHSTYILKKLKSSILPDSLQSIQWYDGSGLSRYNLFTPQMIIYTLNELYLFKGVEWIKKVFAGGGESGTIRNNYKGSPTYIYAKTGSLMNNHSLGGYIQTRSGKWLLFSFMHSNYTGSAVPIRAEMQNTLEYIKDHF